MAFIVFAVGFTCFGLWAVYWLFLPGHTSPERDHSGTVTVRNK